MKPSDLLTATHPLLSDRVRLAIMASLAAAEEPIDFNGLLESLELTKGKNKKADKAVRDQIKALGGK